MATIIEQINALAEAKADIQAAVVEKGGVVSGDTLAGLADDVRALPQSADFDWSSIGYSGMPSELREVLEDAAARKVAYNALPDNQKWNAIIDRDVVMIPAGLDWSLLGNRTFNGCRKLKYFPPDVDFRNLRNTFIYMFQGCLSLVTLPEVEGCTFEDVENGTQLFYSCSNLEYLPDTALFSNKLRDAGSMFCNCNSMRSLPKGDFSGVVNALNMFANCTALEVGEDDELVGMAPSIALQMFFNTPISHVPKNFDFSNLTNASYMFSGCANLLDVPSDMDLSNVTDASYMFQNCKMLVDVPSVIDLPNTQTAMYMFAGCTLLTRLHLRTPNVTNFNNVCRDCWNITWIRLDGCNAPLTPAGAVSNLPLTADGVYNLIDSLADRSGQSSLIVQLSAAAKANMSDETRALAASKNWTIA